MDVSLSGRVAIVTGAARGLGRVVAQTLAESGADVVIADIQEDAGALAASELTQLGVRSVFVRTDVGKPADCRRLVDESIAQLGQLDVLVNNAGICPVSAISEIDEELWNHVIDVNLRGTFFCSQAAAERLKERPAGRIINIASIAAHNGGGLVPVAHYASSKGGMISMTRSFATYLAPHGCTANAIAPAPFLSDLTADFSDEVMEQYKKVIPLGRLGTSQDMANAVLFLASDLASFITGAVLDVNGGWLMR
jgi:3-oxoacyl-[acyl-carrier protein] reductase